ncbi:twin-arginine translocase subunit TatC [Chloroflexota bacterium]
MPILIRVITAPFRWIFNGLLWLLERSPFRDFFAEEPDDTPILDTIQKATDEPGDFLLSLLEHLNDLRKHLFRAVIGLALTTIVAFYFVTDIMDWLASPIGGIEELQAIEVTEPIGVVMRVTLLTGFTAALPYITFEILRFLAPGISRRSRLIGLLGIPFVFFFFVSGMLFAYYLMLPAALPILLNFMGIPTMPRPASYLRFVTGIMFWIGISFELPLVSLFLSAMGILRAQILKNQWRIAIIILTIFSAMVTPTIDPINMMIVLLPLLGLYLLSIIMAYIGQGLRGNLQ